MPLWGSIDTANNKPTFANTADVFGVDKAEAALQNFVAYPGWVQVQVGYGPVVSVAIGAGGTGYANGEVLTFTGGAGTGAAGTVSTDGAGVITSVTLTAGGTDYTSAPTVGVTTGAGTGATLTATVGGRAGRVTAETLVALGSMSSDASDDTLFPDA